MAAKANKSDPLAALLRQGFRRVWSVRVAGDRVTVYKHPDGRCAAELTDEETGARSVLEQSKEGTDDRL